MTGPQPKVIYENKDIIVVDKPAGLMVHGVRLSSARPRRDVRPAEPTLVDWLLARYPEIRTVGDDTAMRPGIVHRLDKETSGVMVVARTQASFEYLKSLFESRAIEKKYLAVVAGVPREQAGTIDAPIGIRSGTLRRSVHSAKMAKPAVTDYRVLSSSGEGRDAISLLEVTPRTGRTHQIRVHLASIGHPVMNDPLYGKKTERAVGRLMLHAENIAFTGPDGHRYEFGSPDPFLSVIHR